MIYPANFEAKTGFHRIRKMIAEACLSSLGKRKVEDIAFQKDFIAIQNLLNEVEEFRQIILFEDNFPLNNYIDVTQSFKKARIEGAFLEVNEVFDIKRSLEAIRAILSFFHNSDEDKYLYLKHQTRDVKVYPFVLEQINTILTDRGRIRDNASPNLLEIRQKISRLESEVSKRIQQVLRSARSAGWVPEDASVTLRNGRPVIPVNAADKRKLKGFVHDESASGKTSFIEPAEIFEANNEIRELEYAERREIITILTAFTDSIRPYIDDLLQAYDFMGRIDLIRAKASVALKMNGIMPKLFDEQVVHWRMAVHPLLYLAHQKENKEVVPLELELNAEQRILVISGPNAGGKSVCLQTTGLLQYMLQCGLLVPASENSEAGIFENIFIDIGDEQSIDNDLSTYSSHLTNMKFFQKNAGEKTLLLIDEFGTGTEPMLGGAIAEALLDSFNSLSVFGVITTHYTNLKHFASSHNGIINGAMMFDTQHMQPLFKLQIGEPGSSFAFEIARKIGLPERILQDASEKIGQEHIDFDKHLKDIIRDKRYWENKRMRIRKVEKDLDETLTKYAEALDEIKQLRREALEKAQTEARELVAGANKQIENTIREIKESNAEKERTRQARKDLDSFKNKLNSDLPSPEDEKIKHKMEKLRQKERRIRPGEKKKKTEAPLKKAEPVKIKVGDKVKMKGQHTVGEVIDINNKNYIVAFGNLTTTLEEKRLEKVSNYEAKKISSGRSVTGIYNVSERKLNFKPRIDVRGQRADEALQKVMDFVDEAIMVNAGEIKILHGKGNGILRQLIRDYLKTTPGVASFNDEHVQYGGAGITVVQLG